MPSPPRTLRSGGGVAAEEAGREQGDVAGMLSRVTRATETSICPGWLGRARGPAPREEISH